MPRHTHVAWSSVVCTGRHQGHGASKQDTYRGAWAWAWASAISASVPNRQGMECATHSIGIPVRYTGTVVRLLLRSRQRYRAWRITCQRLRASFALPNGCPPRSAMSIPCAPAADEAATWTMSRGAASSCMVKTGCVLCLCDGHGCSSMAIASMYGVLLGVYGVQTLG